MNRGRLSVLLWMVLTALALRVLFPTLHDGATRLASCAAGINGAYSRIETMGGSLAEYGLADTIVLAFDAAWSGEAHPAVRIEKGRTNLANTAK